MRSLLAAQFFLLLIALNPNCHNRKVLHFKVSRQKALLLITRASIYTHNALDLLTRPLLLSQRRCCVEALYPDQLETTRFSLIRQFVLRLAMICRLDALLIYTHTQKNTCAN